MAEQSSLYAKGHSVWWPYCLDSIFNLKLNWFKLFITFVNLVVFSCCEPWTGYRIGFALVCSSIIIVFYYWTVSSLTRSSRSNIFWCSSSLYSNSLFCRFWPFWLIYNYTCTAVLTNVGYTVKGWILFGYGFALNLKNN